MSANNAETINASDCDIRCRTVHSNTTRTVLWTIENFMSRFAEENDYSKSSEFTVTCSDGIITTWNLDMCTKNEMYDSRGGDFICVYLNNCSDFDVTAKCSFSIIDSSKKQQDTFHLKPSTFTHGEYNNNSWGGKVVKLEKLKDNSSTLLSEGNLIILCKLVIFGEDKYFSDTNQFSNKTTINEECQSQVTDHLGKLLAEKNCYDLEVSCDEEVFPCHQAILSARSPVFLAMFQADMVEKQSKKVIITDVKKEVFREMLRFIYTGKVSSDDSLKELARDLLFAANKYQLDLLKKLCEAQLCSTLDGSNCLELLVVGDLHEATNLKTMALESVLMNLASLSNTDVYKDFVKKCPELAVEVTLSMFSKENSSTSESSDNDN